jgi:hypothetical protein
LLPPTSALLDRLCLVTEPVKKSKRVKALYWQQATLYRRGPLSLAIFRKSGFAFVFEYSNVI